MNHIEIEVLNPEELKNAEKMMVAMARMTQKSEKIANLQDLHDLLDKPYTAKTVKAMSDLPHGTIKEFGKIHVAVVGASRRFLAQITRHRVGVTYMSGSLHYCNYGADADFVVPYDFIGDDQATMLYLNSCKADMDRYNKLIINAEQQGLPRDKVTDAAGYAMPQGMRNVLIISADIREWENIIAIRTCRRNAKEIRYICLRIAEEFTKAGCKLLTKAYPSCVLGTCVEGHMSCGTPVVTKDFTAILNKDYKKIR